MRNIYIIGIDNDPDGCYITDALEKPEHTIAGPFHSQQNAIIHAIDAELRVHSQWNEIWPEPQSLTEMISENAWRTCSTETRVNHSQPKTSVKD
jgi:hypothetical protein